MGKKYIIELPENTHWIQWLMEGTEDHHPYMDFKSVEDLTPYTEPDLEQVRKEAYGKGYEDAEEKYNDGYSDGYDAGLADAWEAARKIVTMPDRGFINSDILDLDPGESVFTKYTASEAIEKIRQYEQEKEEQIQVGDEVIPRETKYDTMIVTRLWKDDYDSDCIDAIGFDGRIGSFLVSRVSKTGKHYEIAAVLQKMRGEQE